MIPAPPTVAWSALLLVVLGGCDPPNPGSLAVGPVDVDRYADYVHPYVEARCGTLDCHGDPGRPLRVFAETGLRMADGLRASPITGAELRASAESIWLLEPGASDERRLALQKPLPIARGGFHHVGGAVWRGPLDPGYLCLYHWLAGSDDGPIQIACFFAVDAITRATP